LRWPGWWALLLAKVPRWPGLWLVGWLEPGWSSAGGLGPLPPPHGARTWGQGWPVP